MNLPLQRNNAAFGDANDQRLMAITERLLKAVDPEHRTDDALRRLLERALTAAAEAEGRISVLRGEIQRLRTLSITDEATELLNHRGFTESLRRSIDRGRRYGETGALLLIDLDGFKAVNDTYGHAAGDHVLISVARALRKCVRTTDDVARIGGDEFAVLLNHTPARHAEERADFIEQHLNSLVATWRGKNIHVRASIGCHCFSADANAKEVFDQADDNMYLKKRGAALAGNAPA
jgi:diguanylate cyclase (GGDEF)-like protein